VSWESQPSADALKLFPAENASPSVLRRRSAFHHDLQRTIVAIELCGNVGQRILKQDTRHTRRIILIFIHKSPNMANHETLAAAD
jgi:hypothetical protein